MGIWMNDSAYYSFIFFYGETRLVFENTVFHKVFQKTFLGNPQQPNYPRPGMSSIQS